MYTQWLNVYTIMLRLSSPFVDQRFSLVNNGMFGVLCTWLSCMTDCKNRCHGSTTALFFPPSHFKLVLYESPGWLFLHTILSIFVDISVHFNIVAISANVVVFIDYRDTQEYLGLLV